MGFPTLCYCVLLPTPMIVLLQILDQIRLLLSSLLHFLGLSSILHVQTTDPTHQITFGDTPCLPITPHSIKTRLQVVKFSAFCSRSQAKEQEQACVVCLSGLEGRHEVRVLGNCTHAFHKGCIDKWIDLGQVTCPLCRSRLLPRGGPGWWPPLLPSL